MEKKRTDNNALEQIRENVYKEILQNSPNTPVFFPYAQILIRENRISEAIAVLKNGLQQYPEHFSAELLLIELYYKNGFVDSATQEFNKLISPLLTNNFFWKLLGNSSLINSEQKLFINLFSAGLNTGISLSDLVKAGKNAVDDKFGEMPQVDFASSNNSMPMENLSSLPATFPTASSESYTISDTPQQTKKRTPHNEEESSEPVSGKNINAPDYTARSSLTEKKSALDSIQQRSVNKSVKGKKSTITLTMADLLLDQGQYEEALSICKVLIENAKSDAEREEINKRIQIIRKSTSDSIGDEEQRKKIILFLNQLAERLNNKPNQSE